jgi:Ca2+-binding RTX toxin-like protein
VHAGDGNDHVRLVGGTAWGNTGADTMIAAYQGTLNGGAGNDRLSGVVDLAANTIPVGTFAFLGATGRDRITLPRARAGAGVSVTTCGALPTCTGSVDGGTGSDLLDLTAVLGPTRVHLHGPVAYRLGRATVRSVERVVGSRGNDRIWGTAARNVIDGKAGNDRLVGGRGRDLLIGGPGRDGCSGEVRRSC